MSQLFATDGQSIGASVSASVLPKNIQSWCTLEFTSLISLQSKGLSRVFPKTTFQKHQFFGPQPDLWSNQHPYMITRKKKIALTIGTFVGKVMFLLFNALSRFVTAFLPRNKCLLISWLESPSAVILQSNKIKSATVSTCFPHLFAMKWWDQMPWS